MPRGEQVSADLRERRRSIPPRIYSRPTFRPPPSSVQQYDEGPREDVVQGHNQYNLWVGHQRRPTIRPNRGFSRFRSPRPRHKARHAMQANRRPLRAPRLRGRDTRPHARVRRRTTFALLHRWDRSSGHRATNCVRSASCRLRIWRWSRGLGGGRFWEFHGAKARSSLYPMSVLLIREKRGAEALTKRLLACAFKSGVRARRALTGER
jgi:hypothetical protein